MQKTREQLDALNRRVEASRTYLEMAELRYDEGYISFIEVLDAQRTLFEASTTQAETQGAVFNSLVNLYKTLGGGWVVAAEDMALGAPARLIPASTPPGTSDGGASILPASPLPVPAPQPGITNPFIPIPLMSQP